MGRRCISLNMQITHEATPKQTHTCLVHLMFLWFNSPNLTDLSSRHQDDTARSTKDCHCQLCVFSIWMILIVTAHSWCCPYKNEFGSFPHSSFLNHARVGVPMLPWLYLALSSIGVRATYLMSIVKYCYVIIFYCAAFNVNNHCGQRMWSCFQKAGLMFSSSIVV